VLKLGLIASVLFIACVVFIAAMSNNPSQASPSDLAAAASNTGRPGSAVVYDQIARMSSCVQLQREFDVASENAMNTAGAKESIWATGYMNAAYERMQEVGCF
jgi:hypothetical protein